MSRMITALPCSSSSMDEYHDQDHLEEEQHTPFRRGILEVRVHDAQGIHNICIYDKQDVFAKFSFTHGKAEPVCTQVIPKGGTNPVFNQSFHLPVTVPDSVLKCEMWMSSRAHSYLEDQLLGFVLVPLSSLAAKLHHSDLDQLIPPEEYGLSSTELFHSPAGTVRLTLVFREAVLGDVGPDDDAPRAGDDPISSPPNAKTTTTTTKKKKKHTFIKVFEDGHGSYTSSGSESPPLNLEGDEFERIEFPDLQAASEDQQLVSSYLKMSCSSSSHREIITGTSLLSLSKDDGSNSHPKNNSSSPSSSGGVTVSSDEHESESNSASSSAEMNKGGGVPGVQEPVMKSLAEELSSSSSSSSLMQQQIVDMYMKSMQQFTEALAKMQLPLDMDDHKVSTPNAKKNKSLRDGEDSSKKKTSGHRVFYGSRAFF